MKVTVTLPGLESKQVALPVSLHDKDEKWKPISYGMLIF
jgi:hypothetical protein